MSRSSWWSLSLRLSHQKPVCIPICSICATFPACLILLDLIILIIFGEEYEFWNFSSCNFLQPPIISSLFGPNILSTLFFVFTPYHQRPSSTPIQKWRQNYNFVYCNFYVFTQQARRKKFQNWVVTSITGVSPAHNFLINQILICYCCSQIFEVLHIFKSSVSCLYVIILPCILVMRHQHILRFLCVYFWTNLLTNIN
jgi:hypothetical protein